MLFLINAWIQRQDEVSMLLVNKADMAELFPSLLSLDDELNFTQLAIILSSCPKIVAIHCGLPSTGEKARLLIGTAC